MPVAIDMSPLPLHDERAPAGYRTQAADTAYPIERMLVKAWQCMPPWDKAARLVECCCAVEQLALAGLRVRHPGDSERELQLRAATVRLGHQLVRDVYGWDPAAHDV